jgi:hypothetical protein
LIGSLVIAALGRPRGFGDFPSKSAADSKNKASSEGASSRSFQIAGNERFFSFIGFSHTKDPANAASWCSNQDNQPLIKPSNTDTVKNHARIPRSSQSAQGAPTWRFAGNLHLGE